LSCRWSLLVLALLASSLLQGCAALTNPVGNGVPVHLLAEDVTSKPKNEEVTLPIASLGQQAPDVYRLDRGDVLGIFVEGILEHRWTSPPPGSDEPRSLDPFLYPLQTHPVQQYAEQGFLVREDGTVNLPQVGPVRVTGLSILEAERAVRHAYTSVKQILKPGQGQVVVELLHKRTVRVHVVRQDHTTGATSSVGNFVGRRGYACTLQLPAYENDILNALTRTGGLPSNEGVNQIIVQRHPPDQPEVLPSLDQPGVSSPSPQPPAVQNLVIPLRIPLGAKLPFRPQDVVLHDGDVVFIESRANEVFYAGGLLPPGEYPLPRDRNLDVVEAIALIKGPILNGGLNQSNLSGQLVGVGIGNPSPSRVSILRRTDDCHQLNIRVDLNLALQDPRERVVIHPGDLIILQETPCEAIERWCSQAFKFVIIDQAIRGSATLGTGSLAIP
jgi:protein involved in polysaccharide export with SLBB domain